MQHSIRRELRFLRIYTVTSSIVLVVLCTSAFRQAKSQALDELTARGFRACLAPDSYEPSQALAADLLENGALGIVYPSVRRQGDIH